MPGPLLASSIALLLSASALGCTTREQWGFPSIPASVTSPDGRWTAFARNHANPDPPSQSIWLQPAGQSAILLRALTGDVEWISAIVWSGDSQRVGFLIMDAPVDVYDVGTRTRVFTGLVRWPNTNYPPRDMLRDLVLSADGQALSFTPCQRTFTPGGNGRLERHIECSDRIETTTLSALAEQRKLALPTGPRF